MTLEKSAELICILKKENESNSPEEKEFNLNWIRLIQKAQVAAISKTHKRIEKIIKRSF